MQDFTHLKFGSATFYFFLNLSHTGVLCPLPRGPRLEKDEKTGHKTNESKINNNNKQQQQTTNNNNKDEKDAGILSRLTLAEINLFEKSISSWPRYF